MYCRRFGVSHTSVFCNVLFRSNSLYGKCHGCTRCDTYDIVITDTYLLIRPFPTWDRSIELTCLASCASSILTCFSFMSFLITSLHFSFGLPIFRCPPTSIFRVLITTSSSVYISLSKWHNHLNLVSLIFSLMFATLAPCSYFFIPHLRNHLYSHFPS